MGNMAITFLVLIKLSWEKAWSLGSVEDSPSLEPEGLSTEKSVPHPTVSNSDEESSGSDDD